MNYLLVISILYFLMIIPARKMEYGLQKETLPTLFLIIATFGLIVGLRWMVGNDYESYFMCLMTEIGIERLEFIPRMTIHYFYTSGLPFYLWFIIFATIQISLYLMGYLKEFSFALPLGLFFFFSYELSFFTSGVRQATALCCVYFAYTFIKERKLTPYLILMALAFLNHKSAILAFPVYWLLNGRKPLTVPMQIVIFTIATIAGRIVINYMLGSTADMFDEFGYGSQQERILNNEKTVTMGSGLGVIFYYCVYIYIILISPKIIDYYKNTNFSMYYNLFFIGVCAYMATMDSQYLARAMKYFTIATPLVLACSSYYLFYTGKKAIAFGIISCYAAITVLESFNKTWSFVFLQSNFLN